MRTIRVLLPSRSLPFGTWYAYPPESEVELPKPVILRLKTASHIAFEKRDQHPLMQGAASLPEVKRPLDDADSNESTPPGAADVLSVVFEPGQGALDASFFSTERPLDPSLGGINWHFAPPQPILPQNLFGFEGQNASGDVPQPNLTEQFQWTDLLDQFGSSSANMRQ